MNFIAILKAMFFPSVASITADFHKVTAKLEAFNGRMSAEIENHFDSIDKHLIKIKEHREAIDLKDAEVLKAEQVIANISSIINPIAKDQSNG